jgi:hypothetical protein
MATALSGRLGGADASDPATIRNFQKIFNVFVPSSPPAALPTSTPSVFPTNISAALHIQEDLMTRQVISDTSPYADATFFGPTPFHPVA